MTPAVRNPLTALALAAAILAGPSAAEAALGDCIQPVSTGAAAVVTDCLVILQTAVSANNCNGQDPCVCSPKGTEPPSATDALLCLQVVTAVADPSVLNCPCDDEPLGPQCSSGEFIALGGSDVDSGWNGLGHGQSLIEGASNSSGGFLPSICVVDDRSRSA